MKKSVKFCAFILATAFLLSLAGCGQTPIALSYGESVVTADMYRYWLSSYKGTFLYTYSDMTDTDAFWDSVLYGDTTAEAHLNAIALENVKRTLICMELFRQLGLSVPESTEAEIDQYMDDLLTEYADGDAQAFDQMLSEYGINGDTLRQIYIEQEKPAIVFRHLYKNGGTRAVTETELDGYYRENYVRVRHIYVNDAYKYETDDAGYYRYDSAGNVLTRSLTEAEKAEKAEKIAAIEKALSEGQGFTAVYEAYSEDLYYENGYYLTRETDFIAEVVDAAFSIEIGETAKVESQFGMHWILRLPLEDNAYGEPANGDFFDGYEDTVANDAFMKYLDELLGDVTVYEDEIGKYSIRDAAVNYAI